MKTRIIYGKPVHFLGYDFRPYKNTEIAEDFGLDVYENGKYLFTIPTANETSINYNRISSEFKVAGYDGHLWERQNEAKFGKDWRLLYNGL